MGKVMHFELGVDDLDRAKNFYSSVFGWKLDTSDMPGGGQYTSIITTDVDPQTMTPTEPGAINGGMVPRSEAVTPAPVVTIGVDGIDAALGAGGGRRRQDRDAKDRDPRHGRVRLLHRPRGQRHGSVGERQRLTAPTCDALLLVGDRELRHPPLRRARSHPKVLKALEDVGYEAPSPIQAETIPPLLAGPARRRPGPDRHRQDRRVRAADPAAHRPRRRDAAGARADADARAGDAGRGGVPAYAAHLKGLHVLPVYGGQRYGLQQSALRRGVHVVVGTPGRIMDHLDRGTLDLEPSASSSSTKPTRC